ncbi:MAG: type I-C CRISPR-associated endonuclease Cas1c [Bacillota bacterium]|nr:type I-C CRISPR-associated endonuclease Cas1c [Bacillota bacterium]
MRKLLNTLFVTNPESYLALEGESVVIWQEQEKLGQFPLLILEGIHSFSYKGASPALMGACGERGIQLSFLSPKGQFLARSCGKNRGNVLLRKQQYRISDDPAASCLIARNFIFGKIHNCRWSLDRSIRDHGMRVNAEELQSAKGILAGYLPLCLECENLEELRGLEGSAAMVYFAHLDELILNQKEDFFFHKRSRRPPLDRVNAMLSFAYSLLAGDCASALESVGLDSYVGFLHRDRPGRQSLALDLMEELRCIMADRFVITLINNRVLRAEHFETRENGATLLRDDARKKFLSAWQERKKEVITHPYLKEKIPWGLVPYVQALLLARHLRGDLDGYPTFLWK